MKNKTVLAATILLIVILQFLPLLPQEVDAPNTEAVQDASIQNAEAHYKSANYAEALENYYVLANEGNAFSQYMTGYMYFYGEGTGKDVCEATYWFDKAARAGYGFGQFELARAYYEGFGIERNNIKAYLWIRGALETLKELDVKSRTIKTAKNQYDDIEDALKKSRQLNEAADLYKSWQYQNEEPVKIIRLRKIPVIDLSLRGFYNTLPCEY